MKGRNPSPLTGSQRLFHWLTWAYPPAHRREYGGLMEQVFMDQSRRAIAQGGRRALAALWLRTLADLAISALGEHVDQIHCIRMARRTGIALAAAILMALFLGYVDLNASEVQPVLMVVLVCGFALGLAQPARAWRWALILSLGISLAELLAVLLGYEPAALTHARAAHPGARLTFGLGNVLESLVVMVPAMISTYGAVALRRMLGS